MGFVPQSSCNQHHDVMLPTPYDYAIKYDSRGVRLDYGPAMPAIVILYNRPNIITLYGNAEIYDQKTN